MTASPLGAAVDDLGKRLQGASPSGRPTAVLRATPRPRLLHHAQGRQPGPADGKCYTVPGRDLLRTGTVRKCQELPSLRARGSYRASNINSSLVRMGSAAKKLVADEGEHAL